MEEERERGLTMDTDEREVDFEGKKIIFIDTPGHRDYLVNSMQGCC